MIESVFRQGDDALANTAEIQFPVSDFNFFGLAEALKFRTTQITIPEYTIGMFEVHYKTEKFRLPSGKDESPKTMTFTFRVDKYFLVYKALMAWWKFVQDSKSTDGYVAMAENLGAGSNARCNFSVRCIDSNGITTTEGWKFTGGLIETIGGIEFDQTSGEPVTCQVTMAYIKAVPMF